MKWWWWCENWPIKNTMNRCGCVFSFPPKYKTRPMKTEFLMLNCPQMQERDLAHLRPVSTITAQMLQMLPNIWDGLEVQSLTHAYEYNSFSYSDFLFLSFVLLKHVRTLKQQILKKKKTRSRATVRRKTRTSRLWYWYQVSSWAWTLRCLAPLFLMVNSIQNTASSRGLSGLSWWILDRCTAFCLYLFKCFCKGRKIIILYI